jgi:hypothetical protein
MMVTTEPNDQNDKAPRVDVIALTISDPFGSPHLPITHEQANRQAPAHSTLATSSASLPNVKNCTRADNK